MRKKGFDEHMASAYLITKKRLEIIKK